MGSGIKDAGRILSAIWSAMTVNPRDEDPTLFNRKVGEIGARVKDYYIANQYYPGTRIAPVKVPMEQSNVADMFGGLTPVSVTTRVNPNNTTQSFVPPKPISVPMDREQITIDSLFGKTKEPLTDNTPGSTPGRIPGNTSGSIPGSTPGRIPGRIPGAWQQSTTDEINKATGLNLSTGDRVDYGRMLFGKNYRGTPEQNNAIIQHWKKGEAKTRNVVNTPLRGLEPVSFSNPDNVTPNEILKDERSWLDIWGPRIFGR